MKKNFSILILTVILVLSFTGSAFASFFVQKVNAGYSYLFIDDLNDKSDIGKISNHHFYTESVSLIGLNKAPNLHLGFKTAASFGISSDELTLNALITSAVSGVIDYTYPVSEAFSIGVSANTGINVLSLISRTVPNDPLSGNPNYVNVWRPYFQAGASLTLVYNLGYITNINLTAGYNYNLAIAPWLDLFKIIENSKDIQKDFHSLYVTLGAGISF